MRATIVGAKVSEAALRAACTKVDVPPGDIRLIGGRAWVELPRDVRVIVLDRLADELRATMSVIEVDMPIGQRGDGLHASRSTHRGATEDASDRAREKLRERLADTRIAFDEHVAASEIAWELIAAERGAKVATGLDRDAAWARAILERLVTTEVLELRGTSPPITELADVLQYVGRDIEPWLAERLLDKLVASDAVDEVFVDAETLATIARETRPR